MWENTKQNMEIWKYAPKNTFKVAEIHRSGQVKRYDVDTKRRCGTYQEQNHPEGLQKTKMGICLRMCHVREAKTKSTHVECAWSGIK